MSKDAKILIPPDYSGNDDDENVDDITDIDESEQEKKFEENTTMTTSPFGDVTKNDSSPSGPSWGRANSSNDNRPAWMRETNGNRGSENRWGSGNTNSGYAGNSSYGAKPPTGVDYGGAPAKNQIDRTKKVIFCDVLDCLVETLGSNGRPGLIPRDVYDMRLRFEVLDKIAAFNPQRIFAIFPRNLVVSSNGSESWRIFSDYICCCVSSYLRMPFGSCQILTMDAVGQTKDLVIQPVIQSIRVQRSDISMVGIYSGRPGFSDSDWKASQICGIDYIDLYDLINNMY